MMERAPLREPLTPMQKAVVTLLGLNYTHAQVAKTLEITRPTVRYHLYNAIAKMPGDLPPEQRAVAWVRGATLDVLEGRMLKLEVIDQEAAWRDAPQRIARRRPSTVSGA